VEVNFSDSTGYMNETVNSISESLDGSEAIGSGSNREKVNSGVAHRYHFSPDLVMHSAPTSLAAESLSSLVTQLISRHLKANRRAIALCSPTPGAGCSFMAANIAVAMAKSGATTLLLDANLRNPSIHEFIQTDAADKGFLQLITDERLTTSDVIHTNVMPNLSVIFSGGASEASGTLTTLRTKAILDSYIRDFDFVIIDTPPSSTSSDAVRIASVVKYAAIIVRKDETFVNDVKVLVDELKANSADVLGLYINAA